MISNAETLSLIIEFTNCFTYLAAQMVATESHPLQYTIQKILFPQVLSKFLKVVSSAASTRRPREIIKVLKCLDI